MEGWELDLGSFIIGMVATVVTIAVQYGIETVVQRRKEEEEWRIQSGLSQHPISPRQTPSEEYWGKRMEEEELMSTDDTESSSVRIISNQDFKS